MITSLHGTSRPRPYEVTSDNDDDDNDDDDNNDEAKTPHLLVIRFTTISDEAMSAGRCMSRAG